MRWRQGFERVPDYKIVEYDGKRRIADHGEQEEEDFYTSNTFFYCGYIAGPLIFPGEDVDSELAQVIREGMEEFDEADAFTHNFLSFSLDVPAARLKMSKAYHMVRHAVTACRYPTGTPAMFNNMETGMSGLQMYPYGLQAEDFTMPLAIAELLMQSYGRTIRLFPAWPKEKTARSLHVVAGRRGLPCLLQPGGRGDRQYHHPQHCRRYLPAAVSLAGGRGARGRTGGRMRQGGGGCLVPYGAG